MPFFLRPPLGLCLPLGLGLGLTLSPLSPLRSAPLQCQYATPTPTSYSPALEQDPFVRKQGTAFSSKSSGFLTPSNMRQASLGSVLGLVVGVGLRAFSRALVVVLGMGVVVVEWAAAKGYNLLPLHRIQKYVKGVDLQRVVAEQKPFKISFGAMMALAAFAQF